MKRIFTLLLMTVSLGIWAQEDKTSLIQNPSFETDGTSGWTVNNMQTQSNSVFTRKAGTYYLEKWVNIGQQIGEASVVQTLKNLPQGNYQLTAGALHIQQSGSGSTTNSGSAQTGAYIVAGTARQVVTTMKQYTLSFSVLAATENVEIGLVAEQATGNYLCVDNFKLKYMGAIDASSYIGEIQNLLTEAQALLDKGVQQTAANKLTAAIETANTAIEGTDIETLSAAYDGLKTAIAAGEASRALYDALQARIDYALKVVSWWENLESKATKVAALRTAIETAQGKMNDYTLSDTKLKTAVSTLNNKITPVDKKIYYSTNACGTSDDMKVATNQWCNARSMQSKHWVLYWEAGYGTNVPSAVPGILENADRIFEFYADSLQFITINQGKSKTDTYKMIIRLRHTTDWEASGSGIDDQIGLLTLSNGAHTSRSGQTVAHEIGHCFQYQTHCDNSDTDGFNYNWGQSSLNVFWEMCAQWQAYKFYPTMQFVWDSGQGNDWFGATINGLHRHPFSVHLRYNNYFIQDYICHRHGMGAIGALWNSSKRYDDPFQVYMKKYMTGTTAEKISQLGDEMWEYGARMTTFDLDPIRQYAGWRILFRDQTALNQEDDGFWSPKADNCIENWGNNAIRLNAASNKTVFVEFVGEAGKEGYTALNTEKAGWRYGFVAMLKDSTRVYSDIGRATYAEPSGVLSFQCPANCKYLWLVVSGAPTTYWTRDWPSWDAESTAEQWPYRVKLYQTNVYGKTNNNTFPDGIEEIRNSENEKMRNEVYDLAGRRISVPSGSSASSVLPKGIYIINGRRVLVK